MLDRAGPSAEGGSRQFLAARPVRVPGVSGALADFAARRRDAPPSLRLGTPVARSTGHFRRLACAITLGLAAIGSALPAEGARPVFPKTEIVISVTVPPDSPSPVGTSVRLAGRWVCPATQDSFCSTVGFSLSTTIGGTLRINAAGPEAPEDEELAIVPKPPCKRGFLLIWAVDSFDRPIALDGLVGIAVIRQSDQSVDAYRATAIQAGPGLVTGNPTDVNGDGALGFDGIEYRALPGTLLGDFRTPKLADANGDQIETFLTLLTLDVRAGGPNLPTVVDMAAFSPTGQRTSFSTSFTCWMQSPLDAIEPFLRAYTFGSPTGL
ncbi:MAG TPA: hypothetical protein VFH81_02110, partial [Actinomycetota bacterium]|nr:hypothetical protein [Actinomycetota bacterium]